LILYDHHQSRIVVAALFSQLLDRALAIRKCRRYIRQVFANRIILDLRPPVYRKEIIAASNFSQLTSACQIKADRKGSFVDLDQIRSGAAGSGVMS
jgi:hypothetical protein